MSIYNVKSTRGMAVATGTDQMKVQVSSGLKWFMK